MSYYFKYNFISPESTYAIVLEDLKSYYDTGAVDSLMFPTYLDKALRKLGRATYIISEEMLYVEDFEARLPDNFHAVREAWRCTEVNALPYQTANSFYSQTSSTTIQIAPLVIGEKPCNNPICRDPECNGNCLPELIQTVYKTNHQSTRTFKRQYLLKPGNISAKRNCDVDYTNFWDDVPVSRGENPYASGLDSFDIRDNKFVTNFRHSVVYMIFYATEYDEIGNQMIPDDYDVREYIEAFLKFKMFETLTNQVNDETFKQLQEKLVYYKQQSDEKYILARTSIMKQTPWGKQRRIKETLNRFNMYELPSGIVRYGRRRNN